MRFLRFAFFTLHLGIAVGLLAVTLNAFIPPKWFSFLNLLSLGFPILLSFNIIFTLIWILAWRKRAIFFVIITIMLFNPIRRWFNYSGENKESSNFKVITYNVKGGTMEKPQRTEIINYLEKQNADVVLIQERPWEHFEMSSYPDSNKPVMITQLLTTHKILKTEELFNDVDIEHGTLTDVEIRGKRFRFINVYLEPFSFKKEMFQLNGDRIQNKKGIIAILKRLLKTFKIHQDQVQVIQKAIQESPYPVMVAGDFNAVPNSYEYYILSEGLQDAFVEVGMGSGTSFHDYKFPLRLDYILTSKEIQPVNYKVDRSIRSSDHYPVVAEFKLP